MATKDNKKGSFKMDLTAALKKITELNAELKKEKANVRALDTSNSVLNDEIQTLNNSKEEFQNELAKNFIPNKKLLAKIRLDVMNDMAEDMEANKEEAEEVQTIEPLKVDQRITRDKDVYQLVNNEDNKIGAYTTKRANSLKNIFEMQNIKTVFINVPKDHKTEASEVWVYQGVTTAASEKKPFVAPKQ